MKLNGLYGAFACLLVATLLLTSCTHTGNVVRDGGKTKIGVISIMSGDFAVVGEQVRRSIELTLDRQNITDYEFVYEDGKCDKQLSATAARKLMDVDNAEVIFSAGCSDTTMAIAPIANEEQVTVIMPSTGGENIDNAGEYVFRNGNSDIEAAVQPAKDFVNEFDYDRVALISDQTEAMEDIRQHFKDAYEELGGEIVLDEAVNPQETDFRTIITKVTGESPDAVFINSQTGITGAHFIKQMREMNAQIPIFTNFNTATNTQTEEIAGNATDGVHFYDPEYNQEDSRVQDFLSEYEDTYSSQPPLLFHSIATRDAVMMAVQAIEEAGNDGKAVHDWLLENIDGWNGYMGEVTFDEKGNSQAGYALKRIEDGEFVEV